MCVSISCMPTFKALTQRNTYGYFYFCRTSASYLLVGSDPTTYANFMSAMAVRDFNVFTDHTSSFYNVSLVYPLIVF
jgi:hypothetical protein